MQGKDKLCGQNLNHIDKREGLWITLQSANIFAQNENVSAYHRRNWLRWSTFQPVHMSHIETGYTKLSLPVLVDLACALGVRTDDLIFDKDTLGKDELLEEITLELDGCSKEQLLALRQILSSSKEAIQKYLER